MHAHRRIEYSRGIWIINKDSINIWIGAFAIVVPSISIGRNWEASLNTDLGPQKIHCWLHLIYGTCDRGQRECLLIPECAPKGSTGAGHLTLSLLARSLGAFQLLLLLLLLVALTFFNFRCKWKPLPEWCEFHLKCSQRLKAFNGLNPMIRRKRLSNPTHSYVTWLRTLL